MGEIVDLEIYRKRLKRRTARGQGPGNRRSPDRGPQSGNQSGKKPGAGGSRPRNSSQPEPSGDTKIESSDSKSD